MPAYNRLPRRLFDPDVLKEGADNRLALFGCPCREHLGKVPEPIYESVNYGLHVIRVLGGSPATRLSEFGLQGSSVAFKLSQPSGDTHELLGARGQSLYEAYLP